MKRNIAFLVSLLLHLHSAFGADDTRLITGRWEAKMPGNGEFVSMLTLEKDGTFAMRGKSSKEVPNVWTGRYTLVGDMLELVFDPRDANRLHAPLKFKWDKAAATLSPHSVTREDGGETEPNVREQAMHYSRVHKPAFTAC